ncbi:MULTISPECIES: HAD-IA family hydrolase [Kitasatospora]|uniref:CYTH domain-containing protein n=1 Tax=Kitasatospora cystarginea TaxID=58350 RepID=A0ABN3DK24_9ACTN
MGVETERKFLVGPGWRAATVRTQEIRQGYLSGDPARVVRVRVEDRRSATLTVKGRRTGAHRPEFEYPLPLADAQELLDSLCMRPLVEKRRHTLDTPDGPWIVDEFFGENAGLVLAELETDRAEEITELPTWVLQEVTTDPRFDNAYLQEHPYPLWADQDGRRAPAAVTPATAELVIFDCDGVLVDSEPIANAELATLLTEAGIPTGYQECVDRYMGGSLERVREIVRARSGRELPEDFAEQLRARLLAAFRDQLRPVAGMVDVLAALAERGTAFCVASSSPRDRLALSLEVTGLAPLFEDRVYSAADVARGKPAPDVFLHAAARMGVDPANAVVVEDSGPGVAAALAAGMACVGYAALTPTERLTGADPVVRTAAQLGAALGLLGVTDIPFKE